MHVIIPMAGHSRRFAARGQIGPKALLTVGNMPMIAHAIKMFSDSDIFHIVVNELQIREIPDLVMQLAALSRWVSVTVIPPHELGPAYSALQVEGISEKEEVIISYCDFTVQWDYAHFLRHVNGFDGAIPSFIGFHPASFGNTFYAYMRTDGDRFLELREKRSFTADRTEEHASTGTYYFARWELFQYYANRLLAKKDKTLPEAYVSLLFNDMVADGCQIVVHPVERFICLGTPEDYDQYQYWYQYTRHLSTGNIPQAEGPVHRVNLVPMAGAGSRFREYGYRVAKPLIQVHSMPMLVRAAASMPEAEKWIFMLREQDLDRCPIERTLKHIAPDCEVVPVSQLTSGQAATCLLAAELIADNAELMIASCDYEHRYNAEAWQRIRDDSTIDGAIWTYRMGSIQTKKPEAFAYCRTTPDGISVAEVIEKRTISAHPECDPMVVGTFWYRRAGDFKRGARMMIEKGITVNSEHYVGTSINCLLAEGARFVIFDVEQWVSFGDPFELKLFEYWSEYFETEIEAPN
jgi:NDP-sugar pyrophosphorylase family protein